MISTWRGVPQARSAVRSFPELAMYTVGLIDVLSLYAEHLGLSDTAANLAVASGAVQDSCKKLRRDTDAEPPEEQDGEQ
jgi:hypothetical protein